MMERRERAEAALHRFYQTGYDLMRAHGTDHPRVEGIFVSDCGVLFVRPGSAGPVESLCRMLAFVRGLNQRLLPHRVMLSTAIAYGNFRYEERIEIDGMNKNPILGRAYLRAYLDTQEKRPKLRCGYARVVREGMPPEVIRGIEGATRTPLSMLRPDGRKHFNYYWMRERPEEIADFETDYRDSGNLIFEGIRMVLNREVPSLNERRA